MDIRYTVRDVSAGATLLQRGALSELISLVDSHWLCSGHCSIMLYADDAFVGSGFYYGTCNEDGVPGLQTIYEKADALGLGQLVSEHIAGDRVIVI